MIEPTPLRKCEEDNKAQVGELIGRKVVKALGKGIREGGSVQVGVSLVWVS